MNAKVIGAFAQYGIRVGLYVLLQCQFIQFALARAAKLGTPQRLAQPTVNRQAMNAKTGRSFNFAAALLYKS